MRVIYCLRWCAVYLIATILALASIDAVTLTPGPVVNVTDFKFQYMFQIPLTWTITQKPVAREPERFTIKSQNGSLVRVIVGLVGIQITSLPPNPAALLDYCLQPYIKTIRSMAGQNERIGKHEIVGEANGFFCVTDMVFESHGTNFGLSAFQFFRYNSNQLIIFTTITQALLATLDKGDIGKIFNSFHVLK